MADDVIYGAIKTYLKSNWTTTPIAWENENYKPTGAPWILVEVEGALYAQETIGAGSQTANRYDESGVLWIHVYVKSGSGSEHARRYAKQLADLFRGNNSLLSGNIEFHDATIAVGQNTEDGNYWQVTVSIDWYRWEA